MVEILEEIEKELKQNNLMLLSVQKKLDELKNHAITYEAMMEIMRVVLPLNFDLMFDTGGNTPDGIH